MRKRRQRMLFIAFSAPILVLAAGLVLYALGESKEFFFGPTDLLAKELTPDTIVRLGGLVETGSVVQLADGTVQFQITDGTSAMIVRYKGILPDLFREGQGIVATGRLASDKAFVANKVLAKHDETYMPPEVADILKEQGHWQEDAQTESLNDAPAYGKSGPSAQ